MPIWISSLLQRGLLPLGAVGAVCALLLLSACPRPGNPCTSTLDCAGPEICVEALCRTPCTSDDDCTLGYCDLGVCFAGSPPLFQPPSDDAGNADDGGSGNGAGDGGPLLLEDAAVVDAGGTGPAPLDGGAVDAGVSDAGPFDAGVLDGGSPGGGGVDAGAPSPCAQQDPYGADLNGDCIPDMVLGAPAQAFPEGQGSGREARVAVMLGTPDGDFSMLGGAFLSGANTHGRFGISLALDEHVDENGRRGFLVGENNPFGSGTLHQFRLSADDVLTTDAVVAPQGSEEFGVSVASAGSLPGEQPKLGVGALAQPEAPATARGYVALADHMSALRANQGVTYTPELVPGIGGATRNGLVARVPDHDGDGRSDFALSGAGLVEADDTPVGVAIISSASLAWIETLPSPVGTDQSFGAAIASLPDYDGDGVGEMAISAPDQGAGRVYIRYSSSGAFVVIGPPAQATPTARFGTAVAVAGDLDGDGYDDVAVGAPFSNRVFPSPANGEPDKNLPLAECAALYGASYSGNCAGLVAIVFGHRLVARAFGGAGTEIAVGCLQGGAGARAGTALRAIGPHPTTGAMRMAFGAPGLSDRQSDVGVLTGTADDDGCAGDVETFTIRDGAGDPVIGQFLGEAIAQ